MDGPAIDCPNGYKEWWIEGVEYTEKEFNDRISSTDVEERRMACKWACENVCTMDILGVIDIDCNDCFLYSNTMTKKEYVSFMKKCSMSFKCDGC